MTLAEAIDLLAQAIAQATGRDQEELSDALWTVYSEAVYRAKSKEEAL